jgi:hypothetical protein
VLRQAESTISVFQNNRAGGKLNSLAAAEKKLSRQGNGHTAFQAHVAETGCSSLLCLFFFIATALIYRTSLIDGPSVLSLPALRSVRDQLIESSNDFTAISI